MTMRQQRFLSLASIGELVLLGKTCFQMFQGECRIGLLK